ncbi:MAG: VCBS repeat-containing protein, partial [Gemmatimonadaceae bacterium]
MKTRPPLILLVVVVALLGAACRSRSSALFELRSPGASGIRFANTITEDDSVHNVLDFDYLYNGAGVAVADFDGDGRTDLFFGGNMVSSRLYLNRGELRFDDATHAAGVETTKWITGVTVVDIDGDGRPDLYLSVAGPDSANRGNLLFVNQGPGADGIPRFAERAKEYGIADVGYNTHAAFFDYDRDGDLDLYVLKNALEAYNRNITRPRKLNGEAPSTDRLYRNDGNGHFTDVSRAAGILQEGYGLGIAVTDLNRDGWPDVYVANDFLTNDLVWINNGDSTFTNQAARYLRHQSFNAMGVDVADYNNDGLVDVMVVDMLPPDNFRRKLMYPGGNYDRFHQGLELGYQPSYVRNTLQLNDGPGPDGTPTFSEIGQLAGVDATDWSWAPLFADLDNDGRKDLFVSNGYRQDVTNLDYVAYLQTASQFGAERERRARLLEGLRNLPEVKVPNFVFRNEGDLTFSNRTKEWGLDEATFANGAAYADLDGDGDLDLVVNNIDAPASLYVNHAERLAGRHWLRVTLVGPAGNSAGLGAQVSLFAGGTRQYLEQNPVRGYVSSVDPVLHFGLGAAAHVDSIEVRWLDGACQRLGPVDADRLVKVDRRDAGACPPPAAVPDERLFHLATGTDALPFVHVAREFPDFKVTPLLPHKLSEGGPGIAVGDVNGDGRDDVYLGADRGQSKGIWLQTAAGHFTRREIPGAEQREDMGALLFDADGDGDLDLVVTSGGGFVVNDSTTYLAQLYVNDGHGGFTPAAGALAGASTSASSVVAADYDADGDLDLFIGGRVIPGKYPLPARSYLLRNDTPPGGAPRFTDVTKTVAPSLANIGLVTSALFTDFDQDGRVDLLVAGEWMAFTFLRNAGDRFDDVSASTGLGDTHGWWNSLVGGDFDRDGDIDYVAGNLGLNTRYRATEQKPVRVHAGDFDRNSSLDPVLSSYVGDESYPVASRDLMVDEMITMKGRFQRYEDYARATLDQTL